MAHFKQLGVPTNQGTKPEVKPQEKTLPADSSEKQRPHSDAKKPGGKQRTAVLIGSLVATALLGVFVLESGCSQESNKTAAIATPNPPVAGQTPTTISSVPPSTSTTPVASPPAKKKSRQKKLSASTYTNPAYGVSFRYPKYGYLKEGDEASQTLDGLGPVEMNFVQPGGTTISVVELPRKLYAGTDFDSAFFNVSVNPKLTAVECEQFAFAGTDDPGTDPATTSKAKVGATEFQEAEGFAEDDNNRADVKYYHVYQNGSCYEFALGLETVVEGMPDESKPETKPALKKVNHNEVFRQLNWILSTVKIEPVAAPQKTVPEVAADTAATKPTITEPH